MILTRLKHHVAAGLAERVALCGDAGEMTYAQLVQQVEYLASWLQAHNVRSLALHWENSPAWVVVDLACQAAAVIFTPIPTFFTQPDRSFVGRIAARYGAGQYGAAPWKISWRCTA